MWLNLDIRMNVVIDWWAVIKIFLLYPCRLWINSIQIFTVFLYWALKPRIRNTTHYLALYIYLLLMYCNIPFPVLHFVSSVTQNMFATTRKQVIILRILIITKPDNVLCSISNRGSIQLTSTAGAGVQRGCVLGLSPPPYTRDHIYSRQPNYDLL